VKNKRERRKRIDPNEIKGELIVDVEAYIANKCSPNVKKIATASEHLDIEIYFDKHYFIRHQHGDDNGKREGIELETVQKLVIEAAKHLLFYSVTLKNFSFVNFGPNSNHRVVLTRLFDGDEDLNIVVEYHYLSMHRYEVTLKTAMRKTDFLINDGTFQLKINPDGTSVLVKNENRKLVQFSEYENS
jgi:hypothetical protein